MARITSSRLLTAAALAGLLAAVSGGAGIAAASGKAVSPEKAQAAITARQDNMKGIAGAFKIVRGELAKDAPDFALIAANASDINARARKIGSSFPAGSGAAEGFKSTAAPAIWAKPDAFKAAAKKLADESGKLATLAGQRDKAAVTAQALAMGGACKGCHDQFRTETK